MEKEYGVSGASYRYELLMSEERALALAAWFYAVALNFMLFRFSLVWFLIEVYGVLVYCTETKFEVCLFVRRRHHAATVHTATHIAHEIDNEYDRSTTLSKDSSSGGNTSIATEINHQ